MGGSKRRLYTFFLHLYHSLKWKTCVDGDFPHRMQPPCAVAHPGYWVPRLKLILKLTRMVR